MNQITESSQIKKTETQFTEASGCSKKWPTANLENLRTFAKYYFQRFGKYDWNAIGDIMGESAKECQAAWHLILNPDTENKIEIMRNKIAKGQEIQMFKIPKPLQDKPKNVNDSKTESAQKRKSAFTDKIDKDAQNSEEDDAKILLTFWQESQDTHQNMISNGIECPLCKNITF